MNNSQFLIFSSQLAILALLLPAALILLAGGSLAGRRPARSPCGTSRAGVSLPAGMPYNRNPLSNRSGTIPMSDVQQRIDQLVKGNRVVLFMKGTKAMPQCGFSHQVSQILNHLGVDYRDVNVLDDMGIRDGIKQFSNWPTIPQLYVKGEFIGGCDIVREMYQSGELQQLLGDKGIATKAA